MAIYRDQFYVKRYPGVVGVDGKRNDVIYCRRKVVVDVKEHIIFFGGDIQNYPEEMQSEELHKYSQWNLETTACLLAQRFSNSAIFVIKPAIMFLKMFSVFSNFVPFSEDGIPEIGGEYGSVNHLAQVYRNCLHKESSIEIPESATSNHNSSISLIGFSKGCVVLNQLMFEIDSKSSNMAHLDFIQNLKAVYWLDSGHVGDRNAWITDDAVLKKLVDLNLNLHAHVTPYQVRDSLRGWIGKEYNIFVEKLTNLNAKLTNVHHFFSERGSIENHFNVLKKF